VIEKPATLNDAIKTQAGEWLIRQHSGRWSALDEQALQHWLTQTPEHQLAYQQVQALWRGLDQFKTATTDLSTVQPIKTSPPKSQWRLAGTYALCLLMLTLLLPWDTSYLIPHEKTYSTHKGQQTTINLKDGSELALNTDTEVTVHYNLLSREVTLHQGEALFKVAHEAMRGFVVNAKNGEITDIGTQFNVYQVADKVTVTVVAGAVIIKTPQQQSSPLLAGQQLSYNGLGTLTLADNPNLESITAWRQGYLVFDMTTLAEATEQLARYHPQQFVFDDPKLKQLRISGNFSSNDLPAFLTTLARVYPLSSHNQSDNTIHIKATNRR
jgi:transmembrane sensor